MNRAVLEFGGKMCCKDGRRNRDKPNSSISLSSADKADELNETHNYHDSTDIDRLEKIASREEDGELTPTPEAIKVKTSSNPTKDFQAETMKFGSPSAKTPKLTLNYNWRPLRKRK